MFFFGWSRVVKSLRSEAMAVFSNRALEMTGVTVVQSPSASSSSFFFPRIQIYACFVRTKDNTSYVVHRVDVISEIARGLETKHSSSSYSSVKGRTTMSDNDDHLREVLELLGDSSAEGSNLQLEFPDVFEVGSSGAVGSYGKDSFFFFFLASVPGKTFTNLLSISRS